MIHFPSQPLKGTECKDKNKKRKREKEKRVKMTAKRKSKVISKYT